MSSPNKKSNPLNWLDLPIELWAAIAKSLSSSIGDYLTFRGVCRSWRSAATFENFDSATPRVPWLMYISSEEKEDEKDTDNKITVKRTANLLDLSTKKSHKMTNFSPTDEKLYLSSRGWILRVSNGNGEVCLAHPVCPAKIELPGLATFPKDGRGGDPFIIKMVLSDSPTRKMGDFLVMVIWGPCSKRLGFSKPGDKSWTLIDGGQSFTDIIYHNRMLYAVNSEGTVVECDIHGPNPTQARQVFSLPAAELVIAPVAADVFGEFTICAKMCYLVESCGKFVIVFRYIRRPRHIPFPSTIWFDAFEIDLEDGSHKRLDKNWNKALFLGFNSSVCLELSDWDVVKPNCIYFTIERVNQNLNMGVFCLSSKVRTFTRLLGVSKDGTLLSPSTWVMPSF